MAKRKVETPVDESSGGDGEFVHVRVAEIADSPHQKRRVDEKSDSFKELVQSVKEQGVLQPVLLRVNPLAEHAGEHTGERRYFLVAGHRRVAAARAAGLGSVPAIVRELDERAAAAATVAENLQREDLTPLEEAAGVQELFEAGWRAADVAAELGKSERWVRRRASLVALSESWRTRLDTDTGDPEGLLASWTASHLELVARLPAEVQEEAFREFGLGRKLSGWQLGNFRKLTLADVAREIGDLTRDMSKTRWELDDETLAPQVGSCEDCVKRASREPLLFDLDLEPGKGRKRAKQKDTCLDGDCWERKLEAWLERREAELREKHEGLVVIRTEYGTRDRRPDSLGSYDVDTAKKSDKGARPALVIDGSGAGTLRWVKVSGSGSSGGGGIKRGPKPLKERRQKLDSRRKALAVTKVREALAQADDPSDIWSEEIERRSILVCLAVAFPPPDGGRWHEYDSLVEAKVDEQDAAAWEGLQHTLSLDLSTDSYRIGHSTKHAERLCELLSLDWEKILADAVAEIPEPKSWANLKADGTPKAAKAKKKAKPKKKRGESCIQKKPKKKTVSSDPRVNEHGVYGSGYETITVPIKKARKVTVAVHVVEDLDGIWRSAFDATVSGGGTGCGSSLSAPHLAGNGNPTRADAVRMEIESVIDWLELDCGSESKATLARKSGAVKDLRAYLEDVFPAEAATTKGA